MLSFIGKVYFIFPLHTDSEVSARKKMFTEVQAEGLEQAQKTVLISYPTGISKRSILQYLSRHGNINSHFFYEGHVSSWGYYKLKSITKSRFQQKVMSMCGLVSMA